MFETHTLLRAGVWIIGGFSAILTGIFGSTFGGDYWFLIALFFGVFFFMSILCPVLVNQLFVMLTRKDFARAIVILPFAAV